MIRKNELDGGQNITILIPENDIEQDRLEDLIFEFIRQGGDAKQYDSSYEEHGRFVFLNTESSRYFSVRENENGIPQIHEDDVDAV